MSTLENTHAEVVNTVKSTAEEFQDKYAEHNVGMPVIVHVFRGDSSKSDKYRNVSTLLVKTEGDAIINTIGIATALSNYDAISVSMSMFDSRERINPFTGEEWGDGEMDYLYREYPEEAARLLNHVLNVVTISKDGSYECSYIPFELDGNEITWEDPSDHLYALGDNDHVAISQLVAFTQTPPPRTLLDPLERLAESFSAIGDRMDDKDVSKEHLDFYLETMLEATRDVATVSLLAKWGHLFSGVVAAEPDQPVRAEIVNKITKMVQESHGVSGVQMEAFKP